MKRLMIAVATAALLTTPAFAKKEDKSSARKQQEQMVTQIPKCTKKLGTIAIVEPDNQWWREFNLGSPENILKVFVRDSGCFTMVNRGRSMASRNMERAMADSGELQSGSNLGKGQVKAADYFLQPDLVTANQNSGGSAVGGILGGALGGRLGGMIGGGLAIKKKDATVTLSLVNARTTEEEALIDGYFRKSDLGFGVGGGLFGSGGFGGAAGGGYGNTEIGQVIVLAYLQAYTKLVTQMGGLPENAAAAAPQAK